MGEFDLSGFSSELFGGPPAGDPAFSLSNEFGGAPVAEPSFSLGGGGAGPATPSAGGGNWWDAFTSGAGKAGSAIGKDFAESPLTAFAKTLGIGATGFNIANQVQAGQQTAQATRGVQRAQKAAETAAAPAVAFGTQTLQDAQGGKLPGPMEAAVAQWVQQAKSAIQAKYAQMGLGNSSDLQGELSKIDLMAESMKGQLLQGQAQTALSGLNTGVSAATGGGQLAAEQQQMLTNLIASANQQLGQLAAKG